MEPQVINQVFQIIKEFKVSGEIKQIVQIKVGHINDTFKVDLSNQGKVVSYILQRINHHVFEDPKRLMDNIVPVTEHTRSKLIEQGEDDIDLFKGIAKGYISSAGKFLIKNEVDSLVLSGEYITLIIGTRFLTDYLSGDVYFKTNRTDQNIDRCRSQFQIVRSIIDQQDIFEKIVEKEINSQG